MEGSSGLPPLPPPPPPPPGPPQQPWGGQQPAYPTPPPQPPRRSGTPAWVIVLIVLGVLFALGLGGCAVVAIFVGNTVDKAGTEFSKSLRHTQNLNAITDAQAGALEPGVRKARVIEQFGPPSRSQDLTSGGVVESCLYYNVRDGSFGDDWQLCFRDSGRGERLVSKRRV